MTVKFQGRKKYMIEFEEGKKERNLPCLKSFASWIALVALLVMKGSGYLGSESQANARAFKSLLIFFIIY